MQLDQPAGPQHDKHQRLNGQQLPQHPPQRCQQLDGEAGLRYALAVAVHGLHIKSGAAVIIMAGHFGGR
jgi:hypothetical protein